MYNQFIFVIFLLFHNYFQSMSYYTQLLKIGKKKKSILILQDGNFSSSTLGDIKLAWYSHINLNKMIEIALQIIMI